MKIHQLAKKLGVKSKELFEECGADHHMDSVPEAIIAKYSAEEPKEVEAPKPVEKLELPEGVSKEAIKISICGGGIRSPFWKYKDLV